MRLELSLFLGYNNRFGMPMHTGSEFQDGEYAAQITDPRIVRNGYGNNMAWCVWYAKLKVSFPFFARRQPIKDPLIPK